MRKGIILLKKAKSKEEAQDIVKEFLKKHKGIVWTYYYRIGGQWSCILSNYRDQFLKICTEKFGDKNKEISCASLYENKKEIQKIWEDLGAKDFNPLKVEFDSSLMNEEYDVMPLEECIEAVKRYPRKVSEIIDSNNISNFSESYYNLMNEELCNICDVYNIETANYNIPSQENLKDYYAIIVDIHY